MTDSWWPAPLAHIPNETPWEHEKVVVAEIRSFEDSPYPGQRRLFSALIPADELENSGAELSDIDFQVSTSGPHPVYDAETAYVPKFWVSAPKMPSERYEPLILAWTSHDKTALWPDPGFLMTYGLVQRPVRDGGLVWDDPEAPKTDIVFASAPAIWDSPRYTQHAHVSIAKDYLQDYLTLRNMVLVHIYWEQRWAKIDDDIEAKLGNESAVDLTCDGLTVHIGRAVNDKSKIFAQVWGHRIVGRPSSLPITEDPLDSEGLDWPGIEYPVTNAAAQSSGLLASVYVDDAVLATYEGRPQYEIHPESGSVSHGFQWSVGNCNRVGRNTIQIELKKLYEGNRPEVIRHWHGFAVAPPPRDAFPKILQEPNIGSRAKDLVWAFIELGERLADLAGAAGLSGLEEEKFVGFSGPVLEYHGWWKPPSIEKIARHVPLGLSLDSFLERCSSLNEFLIEGMNEKSLRSLLTAIGVPKDELSNLRPLKLLDKIVVIAQVADQTGLGIDGGIAEILERIKTDGTSPERPIDHLFALYDLRIAATHSATDKPTKVMATLEDRFGITPGEEGSGYGLILDKVYDALIAEITDAATKVRGLSS
ncbi:hypothetical protein [Nisaea sediminum]|uniref:hypothetical protein n=1 Tax=Nisaea sediminum TaxID=2775867 RepID=UPI0018684CE1|nr:hypothetical protein [Nisaea sediminum]